MYGHVITKFSGMGRFTYPWGSAGALRASQLRYKIRLKRHNFYLQRLALTRALKGFFSSVQTCGVADVNQPLPWFSRFGQEKILSPFLEHSEENGGVY